MAACAWPLSGGAKSGGSAVALPLPVLSARPLFFARHSGEGRNPAPCLFLQCRAFDSPCGRAGYFWHCPKVTKRLGAQRGGSIRIVRIELPCASRRVGVAQTVHPVLLRDRGDPSPRPFGLFPPRLRCSAPRTAPLIHESVHPCTASGRSFASALGERELLLELLRQDAAQAGPLWRGERVEGKARRVARTMRASSLSAHGCAVSEPPEHARAVGGQATAGCRR